MNVSIQREFVVDAPLERAWQHLARVEAWPSWAKHIKSVTVEPPGELSPSTVAVFRLAFGLKARFAVTEFVPMSHWKWVSKFLGATTTIIISSRSTTTGRKCSLSSKPTTWASRFGEELVEQVLRGQRTGPDRGRSD
jgi:hypothetical protein